MSPLEVHDGAVELAKMALDKMRGGSLLDVGRGGASRS